MKLTQEQINTYKSDFKFELSIDDLKKDWYFDEKFGFTTILNPIKKWCINLKTSDGCWLKIDFNDLTEEQIESLLKQPHYIDEEKLDKLAEEFIKNDYIGGFKAGYRKAMEE